MNIKHLLWAMIVICLVLPQSANARWTDWLTSRGYQSEFNYQASRGRYPRKVNASVIDGEVRYMADFVRTPKGRFRFASHHGVDDDHFREYEYLYEDRGYELIWHAKIRYDGRAYNQGVWVQRR